MLLNLATTQMVVARLDHPADCQTSDPFLAGCADHGFPEKSYLHVPCSLFVFELWPAAAPLQLAQTLTLYPLL